MTNIGESEYILNKLVNTLQLPSGDSYSTPMLYATYSTEGLNGLSARFHPYVRQHILQFPENKVRPVHLNT